MNMYLRNLAYHCYERSNRKWSSTPSVIRLNVGSDNICKPSKSKPSRRLSSDNKSATSICFENDRSCLAISSAVEKSIILNKD